MNYPTSDIQFLAQYVRRLHAGDQITMGERHRLDMLANRGVSSTVDESRAPVDSAVPTLAPHATGSGADPTMAGHQDVTRSGIH